MCCTLTNIYLSGDIGRADQYSYVHFVLVYDEVPLQNYVEEKRPIKEIGGRLGMRSPLHVNYADLPLLKSMSLGER